MIYPAFAIEYDLNSYHADDDSNESSEYSQIVSTSDGTLDVEFTPYLKFQAQKNLQN